MHDFFTSISTEVWVTLAVIVNQGLSLLRTRMAKNKMSTSIEAIKKEVTHNGGESNTLSDKVDRLAKKQGVIEEKVDTVLSQTRKSAELAVNQSIVAQFMCNDLGEITFVNDAMSDFFGVGKNHLMRNKLLNFINDQEIKEEFVRRFKFVLDDIKSQYTFELKHVPIKNRTNKIKIAIEQTSDDKNNFMWFIGKITEMPPEIKEQIKTS